MKDDLRTLLKQNGTGEASSEESSLKVLIVDDEPTVHDITALVLRNYRYRGYKLELISAYSATEAREILASRGPFALILLDVIMETDDAGLELARYVREELKDPMVRIVLRTGQPGMVPQRQVMRDYEIDDYKEKAELTSERFDAAVTASIRSYLGIYRLEQSRQGLLRVLNAIHDLETRGLDENMGHRILDHMKGVMNRVENGGSGSLFVERKKERDHIVSGRGSLEKLQDRYLDELDDPKLAAIIRNAISNVNMDKDDRRILATMLTRDGGRYLAYFEDVRDFEDVDRYLVQLYASHVSLSLSNKILNQELLNTQKEIITTLGEVIESRSGDPHLR
jgi:CheY-like chemotaxis protein